LSARSKISKQTSGTGILKFCAERCERSRTTKNSQERQKFKAILKFTAQNLELKFQTSKSSATHFKASFAKFQSRALGFKIRVATTARRFAPS
jgi:hypothetical protein